MAKNSFRLLEVSSLMKFSMLNFENQNLKNITFLLDTAIPRGLKNQCVGVIFMLRRKIFILGHLDFLRFSIETNLNMIFHHQNYCKDCMSKWFNFDELIKYWAYLVKLEGIEALKFNFQDFEKLILVKEDYWSPLIRCRPFIPSKMMNLVNIILHIIYNVQPLWHFLVFYYHK